MKKFSWLSTLCAVGLVGAAHASAQECADDGDCAEGLVCVSYGVQEGCVVPDIGCAEGEECPEPAPCEGKEVKGCALPPCETDEDCPSGTACHSFSYETCADEGDSAEPDPGCAEGEECAQPEEDPACETPECKAREAEASCEPMTVTTAPQCVPVWTLPCSESADCGAGFTCEEAVSEWCNGSGPSSGGGSDGDPGAGDPMPAPESEPECGTTPTGEFHCEMAETECSSDSDCEAGWSCEDNPNGVVCSGAERPAEGAGSGGSDGSDGFAPPPETPEDQPADDGCGDSSAPAKVCLPPYYSVGYDVAARGEATGAGAPVSDGDSAPSEEPRASGNNASDDNEESSGMEADSSSCAVAAPGANAGGSLLSLLGLIGMCALLRRRAGKA